MREVISRWFSGFMIVTEDCGNYENERTLFAMKLEGLKGYLQRWEEGVIKKGNSSKSFSQKRVMY